MNDGLLHNIDAVLRNSTTQTAIAIISRTRPEIGLAIQLLSSLASGWSTEADINEAIALIDKRAAEHIQKLASDKLHVVEREELEIRLHELLTILVKLGGL